MARLSYLCLAAFTVVLLHFVIAENTFPRVGRSPGGQHFLRVGRSPGGQHFLRVGRSRDGAQEMHWALLRRMVLRRQRPSKQFTRVGRASSQYVRRSQTGENANTCPTIFSVCEIETMSLGDPTTLSSARSKSFSKPAPLPFGGADRNYLAMFPCDRMPAFVRCVSRDDGAEETPRCADKIGSDYSFIVNRHTSICGIGRNIF